MLGHELRNPLAPIVTALQLVKLRSDGRLSKEHEVIERQVKHMVRLVDDLLDVSRITRGKIELKRQRIDVRDILARAIETVSPLLEQKQHHFEVKVPPHELLVDADEARLVQIFANLLNNAAKYTDAGGHIVASLSQGDGSVVLDVRDDGIGIAPDLLPRVFEAFVQGTQGKERAGGGLGLGLALVRTLVSMHGGEVEARSDGIGNGSTFTVRLPAAGARVATKPVESGPIRIAAGGAAARRILVVDDNKDALDLICEILTTLGHTVRSAADGVAALRVAREFRPEVAILDIGLPVMDGYELAGRLRSEFGPATPRMIALTGYGQESDHARSRAAGFESHLVKPVDVQKLMERIGEGG
jgi:CheY-like chemotaxis protein